MIAVTEIGNPFPGLRSFEREQAHLFFGRDRQIQELIERLKAHRFLAIVGVSGSGKSSLVRAGLIPALTGRLIQSETSRWRIATLRPGSNPMTELAAALGDEFGKSEPESALSTLRESSAGIARCAAEHLGAGEKLLLLVDQFEELIRYREQAKITGAADESAAFVKLLLAATGESEHPLPGLDTQPVYVVITMRSDFLGKCSRFRGLPEALNRCQYLVPRLSRDQQRDVIEGPIGMAGASVEPALVQRLLNDWGDNPDQLPPLQHALMRTWEEASGAQARGQVLTVDLYESIGGMADALNRDADKVFEALGGDEEAERIARRLFQRLVEPGAPDEETRRPTALSEIVAVAEAPREKVLGVINVFRERSFLTVSNDEDPIVDITHESLIKNWKRLNDWVQQEARWAALYRRLVGTAELYSGSQKWLPDLELQVGLEWRKEAKPNDAWARRYQPGYTHAMNFLDESLKVHNQEIEAEKERQYRKSRMRARLTMASIGAFLLLAIAASIFAVIQWKRTRTEQTRNGRLIYDASIYFAGRAVADYQFDQARTKLDELLDPELRNLRGFEWFHLWLVIHSEEANLAHHSSFVMSVAFSPDGKTLASASADRTVRLWNTTSRQELATLAHSAFVYSVAFSPDGKGLASASYDKTVRLWDVVSRKELATLAGHSGPVLSVAFSPDGRTLASASVDTSVKLWDVATHKELATLAGHSGSVLSVAFSPDGKALASTSTDSTVKVWDIATSKELATLAGHYDGVYSVAFAPDGKTLASASGDKTVKLWDVTTRQQVATFVGHSDSVRSVAFSANGKTLASAGTDKTVKLWHITTGKELATLAGHSDWVYSVTFSVDGKTIASASHDKTVKLWNLAARKDFATLVGHSDQVNSVAFSPDGKTLASASADKTVKLWDTASRRELATLAGHASAVTSVAFSPDGKTLVSASGDKTVKWWDIAARKELATLAGHVSSVASVAFSPDGKMLASSADKTVKLWDTASHKELATLLGQADYVYSVAFSPDGKTLGSASRDNTVTLRDSASGKELATLAGHSDSVTSVAFSPDGKTLASASADKSVKLWDTASRKELGTLAGHATSVTSVAFSPDGKTLASASRDRTVKLWDTATRKELATLTGPAGYVYSVAFSPDGKTLASASADNSVTLWFATSEEEVETRRRLGY